MTPAGKAKILDSMREVVALHRDRYVFPVRILVTKTQGTGADATFMGMLKVCAGVGAARGHGWAWSDRCRRSSAVVRARA